MDILIQHFEGALISKLYLKLNNTNIVQQSRHASDKDFASQIKKGQDIFDKYYRKIDISPLYTTTLILYSNYCIKYIKVNWKKQQVKPTLKKVKDLWETY